MAVAHLLGRNDFVEHPSVLRSLHLHDGVTPLTTVDWEPKVAVLDQEDLDVQGIDTSVLIPGAPKVKALGSCTANTGTEALSNLLPEEQFLQVTEAASYDDTVGAEKYAIRFYHLCTDQAGDPSQEWPPTDCGSTGAAVVSEMQAQGLASGAQVAAGAQNIVSLMQGGGAMWGGPWFNAWFEPDAHGFIDGNGSASALQAAINSGVAGGHELYLSAIEKLSLTATGIVIPQLTVVRFRNHWKRSWGDNGSGRVHLSTFVSLGGQCDFRRPTA